MGLLHNKVILVTKVTEFAGTPVCRSCRDEGAIVIAQDKKFQDSDLKAEFTKNNPGITVTTEDNPQSLISEVISRHGHIDGLVPNDGFPAIRAAVEEADPEDMRSGLEEMIVEPFRLIGAATPHMKKRSSGRIVIPTSAVPFHGLPNYSMYVTGRGAQISMIQTLAKELARHNIAVNGAAANFIESPSYFSEEVLQNEAVRNKILSQIPLGRVGKPSEFADVITFLLSDKAGFITGHVIPVAGGWA